MSDKITVTMSADTARKFADFLRSMTTSAKADIASMREVGDVILEGMLEMFVASPEQIEEKKALNAQKCTEFEQKIELFDEVSAAFDAAVGTTSTDATAIPNDPSAVQSAIDAFEQEINKPNTPPGGEDAKG